MDIQMNEFRLAKQQEMATNKLEKLSWNVVSSYSSVGLIRFNPFIEIQKSIHRKLNEQHEVYIP
jgi:hypothetical protein